jgi:hypothetical protein
VSLLQGILALHAKSPKENAIGRFQPVRIARGPSGFLASRIWLAKTQVTLGEGEDVYTETQFATEQRYCSIINCMT